MAAATNLASALAPASFFHFTGRHDEGDLFIDFHAELASVRSVVEVGGIPDAAHVGLQIEWLAVVLLYGSEHNVPEVSLYSGCRLAASSIGWSI